MSEREIISKIEQKLDLKLPLLTNIERSSLGYVLEQNKVIGLGLRTNRIKIENIAPYIVKLKQLKHINLYGSYIKNLTFLEELPQLASLWLSVHSEDGADLRGLSSLRRLYLNRIDHSSQRISVLVDSLENLTHFSIDDVGFKNRRLLENLKNLTHLSIEELSNVDYESLRNLKKLRDVHIQAGIEDVSVLCASTELAQLSLPANYIKDISPLESLKHLKYLDISHNACEDISVLSQLTQIESLNVAQNKINSIAPLKNLQFLHTLNLAGNHINEIDAVTDLKRLKKLDIGGNNIADLKPLAGLTHLEVLSAYVNKITNISPLKSLSKLTELLLDNNQIDNVTPLLSLMHLKELRLRNNKIKKFPIELAHLVEDDSNIAQNPLVEPPSEVLKNGGQAVVDYYDKREIEKLVGRNDNSETDESITYIQSVIQKIRFTVRAARLIKANKDTIGQYNEVVNLLEQIINKALSEKIEHNYLAQFREDVQQIKANIPYTTFSDFNYRNHSDQQKISRIEQHLIKINQHKSTVDKQFKFFQSIGFFRKNAVLVGANGSGKTSLSNAFRKYLHRNSIVISSQRIMCVPHLDEIVSIPTSTNSFTQVFSRDRSVLDEEEFRTLQLEFGTILRKLLADNANHKIVHYESTNREKTLLDRCLELWNSLNPQRKLVCNDGINIAAQASGSIYSVAQMSDGEKAMLYLIALVLLAPPRSIIVVDEPEMHLHRTVIDTFWDTLETERDECLFIYLTHDLDFATSRTNAEKIWVKSFVYPEQWETEAVPKNDIPEELLLELLGSKKNILFCEGNEEGYDKRVYSALFPKFTVVPVRGCGEVIKYTKAFNSAPSRITNTLARGLVDADYHPSDTLDAWKKSNVFGLQVPEIENLFLDSAFLKAMGVEDSAIDKIKEKVEKKFTDSVEAQAAKFVSHKLSDYLREEKFKIHEKKEDIILEYEYFTKEIDIDAWYEERLAHLSSIDEYDEFIQLYEGKVLTGIASVRIDNQTLSPKKFGARAVRFIETDKAGRECLYRYFPKEIREQGI